MAKIIINSKQAEKLTKRLNHHFASIEEQPAVIHFEMMDEFELNIDISSVEGNMNFNTHVDKIK